MSRWGVRKSWMRMRCRVRVCVPLVQVSPALVECVVFVGVENSSSSSLSQFASSTAAAGARPPGDDGYWDQRTWPALMPRARPLFCLTSLGMFAVVLVDDVRYQARRETVRDSRGACKFRKRVSWRAICCALSAKTLAFQCNRSFWNI